MTDPAPTTNPGLTGYMKDGWELGGSAIRLVRGQPGLRAYVLLAAAILFGLEGSIAVVHLHFRHDGTIPERIGVSLGDAYLIAVLTNAAAVGLAGMSNAILGGRQPSVAEGARLAAKRFPQVAGWSLFIVLIGVPARLLTSWGVDQIATVILGFSITVISFFAIPAIAIMGDRPMQAARRSLHLVRRFWAGEAAGMVYVWLRPTLFVGLPGALALTTGYVLDREGYDLLGWTIGAAGIVAIAVAYFVFVSARSILSVAIFRYAESGQAPPGFDGDRLQRLMRRPASMIKRIAARLEGDRVKRLREWARQDLPWEQGGPEESPRHERPERRDP
jgi:hypothetical protein